LEEAWAAVEEEVNTADAAEKEVACGWDEKSITKKRESVLICLGL
jgi:hypothetical protein